jgi:hypothetical protein
VTITATVPQGSEIPEGLMNNPVCGFVARLKNAFSVASFPLLKTSKHRRVIYTVPFQ